MKTKKQSKRPSKSKEKHFQKGSKRIKPDKKEYIRTESDWLLDKEIPENIKEIIEFYEENQNLDLLIDELNNDFFKGFLDPKNRVSGQRIKHLPSGKELARGGFSLYAKNLKINKEGKELWDICYENPSGSQTYLYSIEKVEHEKEKKALLVDEFEKQYPNIIKKLETDIKKTNDIVFIALYILIKTNIRVGNLEYFHHYKHQGLTTLQKKNIKINGESVNFAFIGKDGIPQDITKKFPDFVLKPLEKHHKKLKQNDFVFTEHEHPIHSEEFSKILFDYTGIHFYPHIIRSFFADSICKNFLKTHKTATKKEVEECFLEAAIGLGHKKYNKKKDTYEPNFKVTIDNYIRPSLYEELMSKCKKSQ